MTGAPWPVSGPMVAMLPLCATVSVVMTTVGSQDNFLDPTRLNTKLTIDSQTLRGYI